MPRGVAHGPETRSFLMGLHAQGRSLSDLSREFGIFALLSSAPRVPLEAMHGVDRA